MRAVYRLLNDYISITFRAIVFTREDANNKFSSTHQTKHL